jgi:methylase of polypeptide subunit release factors
VRDAQAPVSVDDEEAIEQLGIALRAAGFTVERVESALQTHELSSRPVDTVVHLRRLTDDEPFSTLTAHFVLGEPVTAGAMQAALDSIDLERLLGLGVTRLVGDLLEPLVRIVPHGDYYVASDLEHESGPDTASDFVPGIQAPSVTLAKLAVRRRVDTALDLGTGCGIQALLAAKHSRQVTATDVNPRALRFAAFNLRLNGIENVELRAGDGFEAVEDRRFGLIVSNPPYVISPDSSFLYRDSGLPGDELCRRITQQVAHFLEEDGFGHLLVSWVHEDEWSAPLREWVRGNGCDAWLLHFGSQDPLTHSANWLRPVADSDPDLYAEAIDRWLAYLRSLGVEAIGYGAIVLRRRSSGANWVREDALSLERLESAGEQTLRIFAAQDFLEGLPRESELLRTRFTLADALRLDQTATSGQDGLSVETRTLRLDEGFGFSAGIDSYTAAVLPHFDGESELADVLARASTGVELDDAEREGFATAALPVVRRLLELGFLVPVRG